MFKNFASFDTLRSISAASLIGTYGAVGSALSTQAVCIAFKNMTNGDVIVSTDPANATGMLIFPANSYTVYDIRTNSPTLTDLMFATGTIFYAKDGTTVATTGSFYIEAVILNPIGNFA